MSETNVAGQPSQTAPAGDSTSPAAAQEQVTKTKEQADALVKAAENAAEIAKKKTEDADNLLKGLNKAKRRLKDAGIDEEDDGEKLTAESVANIVRSTMAEFQKPELSDLDKANAKISELKTALQNRSQLAPTSSGSNVGRENANTGKYKSEAYWGPDNLANLIKKGLDPDKVYANMKGPGAPGGTAELPK
jgi:hypothetical protein